MKRLLLWVVAIVIAAAPVVNDVCRLDCERAHQDECPLHQTTPHKCAHDHTSAAASLARAGADVSRPAPAAIPVERHRLSLARASADLLGLERDVAPPPRSPRLDVLRI